MNRIGVVSGIIVLNIQEIIARIAILLCAHQKQNCVPNVDE